MKSAGSATAAAAGGSSRKWSCRSSCCLSPAVFCRRSGSCKPRIPDSRWTGGSTRIRLSRLPTCTAESRRELYSQALDQLRALPGVQSAALSFSLPLMPTGSDCASIPAGPQIPLTTSAVDAGYFDTMGIRLRLRSRLRRRGTGGGRRGSRRRERESRADESGRMGSVGERVMFGCQRRAAGGRRRRRERFGDSCPRRTLTTASVSPLRAPTAGWPHHHSCSDQYRCRPRSAETVRRTLLGLGQGIRVYSVQPLSMHVEQRTRRSDGSRKC